MSKIYLSSDQHFFHENIIKYCNRPFNDEYEMNKHILTLHNKIVSNNDIYICLGDISAGLQGRTDELKDILKQMNGKKILLRGNHDHLPDEFYKSCGFEIVGNFLKVKEYFLNHYGLVDNEYSKEPELNMIQEFKKSNCTTIVHGHKHIGTIELNEQNGFNQRINTAVDMNEFMPIELKV